MPDIIFQLLLLAQKAST